MKAVKMFVGMMVCLVMLAGQAWATTTTLTFDGVTSANLGAYGLSNNVEINGEWGVATVSGNTQLLELSFGPNINAGFGFFNPVNLMSFDYSFNGFPGYSTATITAYDSMQNAIDSELLSIGAGFSFSDWGALAITSIKFSLSGGTLLVDNVTFTPTPIPGAAILLGSGLLGLVGLRRREII